MSASSASVPQDSSSKPSVPSFSLSPTEQATTSPKITHRPSWIGPPRPSRPVTPGIPEMRTTVKVSYAHHGLQPPVYVVTSLSDPPWEPIELQYEKKPDGDFDFSKSFEAEEGPYQYKFRLGPGDWWALDETKPTVDDGTGNRNNLVVVEAPKKDLSITKPSEQTYNTTVQPTSGPQQLQTPPKEPVGHETPADHVSNPDPASRPATSTKPQSEADAASPNPLQARIEPSPSPKPAVPVDSVIALTQLTSKDHHGEEEHAAPLFRHEKLNEPVYDIHVDQRDDAPSHHNNHSDAMDRLETQNDNGAPLFRHETVEGFEAPLFRHESAMPGAPEDSEDIDHLARRKTPKSPPQHDMFSPALAFDNNTMLEQFPTDHDGILQHLRRASLRLPADETCIEGTPPSPSLASRQGSGDRSLGRSGSNESALSSAHLDAIRETEEEPVASTHVDKRKDSAIPSIVMEQEAQADDKSLVARAHDQIYPHQQITHDHRPEHNGPSELLTPPMTPEMDLKETASDANFAPFQNTLDRTMSETLRRNRKDNSTDHFASKTSTPENELMMPPSEKGSLAAFRSFVLGLAAWFAGLLGTSPRITGFVAVLVGVAAAVYRWSDSREARESMA